jgi:hypothetical protein
MSTLKITNNGINYKDAVFAGSQVQNITKFVFANVPGLLDTTPIDDNALVPTAHVVHEQPVNITTRLDNNAVVISCALGHEVGNFDFNWYGAVAKLADNSEILIAVVHTKLQTKTKTVGENVGNYSVKSIIWRSNAIAASLNVSLSTLPWQLNGDDFVSQNDFNNHNHDDDHTTFYISKNETAITTKPKLHVFTDFADLQIPDDAGTAFRYMVDESVVLTDINKCRLLAPSVLDAQKNKMLVNGTPSDICNIQETGIIHFAIKVNGVWKT